MPAGIYLLDDEGKLSEMSETAFAAEVDLQVLLAQHPNLLAGDQIDPESPRRWLLVAREMGIPDLEQGGARWALDHLFLDQDGVPTLVEVKRGGDPRVRREVIGQLLEHGVDYVFGLARNARLQRALGAELAEAKTLSEASGKAARLYRDFSYQTRKSWSGMRRVIGKAEHLPKGANPRFVVTSLSPEPWAPAPLYEQLYCARGEMENRIKEQQLCLFADRTSSHWVKSNQLRLWFSSVAYILLSELRRLGLAGTDLAHARCDTIRIKLLKIGAQVRVSVRRVCVSLSSSSPYAALFTQVIRHLRADRIAAG